MSGDRQARRDPSAVIITEVSLRATAAGPSLRICVQRHDRAPMGFREVYEAFAATYPGCCALQFFPERAHLHDEANKYHLFVYQSPPAGFDLFEPPT